jgi:hypothetical protein
VAGARHPRRRIGNAPPVCGLGPASSWRE